MKLQPCTSMTALAAVVLMATSASASEIRSSNPIATPSRGSQWTQTGNQLFTSEDEQEAFARALSEIARGMPGLVREQLTAIFSKWNSGEFGRYLSPEFPDRQKLLDALGTDIPRDAALKVLGVEGVHIARCSISRDKATLAYDLQSVVSVRVRTQIEYQHQTEGFKRIEGTNEFILNVRHLVVPENAYVIAPGTLPTQSAPTWSPSGD